MGKTLAKREIWLHLFAVSLYGAVALWLTWPFARHLADALAGPSTDALVHYWNGWWARQALQTGQPVYETTYLFYPGGVSLLYHNFAWLSIVPWLGLQTVLDDLVAYNLVFLANLVLCGYTMFLLVARLTGNKVAALLAGLIYLAWPYRLSQLDHPNLISTLWFPLLFLFLIATLREGRWRHALLTGLFLALIGYSRWQLLIPAAITIATYLIGVAPEWIGSRRRWLALGLAAMVAVLLLAPPAWLLFQQQQETADTAETLLRQDEEALMATDLLAYVTPAAAHPLFGQWTENAYDRYYADRTGARRFASYIGLGALALVVLAAWRRPRASLPWLLMAFALLLLALGPVLRVNGHQYTGVPTPYRILQPLFILRLLREPERFNIILALPVAVLAGYGAAVILDSLKQRAPQATGRRALVIGAIGLFILFEYAAGPTPLQSAEISPYFDELAAEKGDFAVLDLPIDALQAKEHMFAQTVHGRPLVHGRVTRAPTSAYRFIDEHPLLRVLRQSNEMPVWLTDVGGQLNSLAQDNIKYIIFHKDQVGADRIAHWQRYLALVPAYEDGEVAVYRTRPEAGRDFLLADELAPGFGPVQANFTGSCFRPGDPVELDVAWGTTAQPANDYQTQIDLVDSEGHLAQTVHPHLSASSATGDWSANTLAWGYYPFLLDSDLALGTYDLVLSLIDRTTGQIQPEGKSFGQIQIADNPCPRDLPLSTIPVEALFGNSLRLLGYGLERPDPNRLIVTLYWRAEQRMEGDYKIFVHIADPSTGVPVAQDDAMPHRNGYPTRFWAPGEVVVDRIPIMLDAAPAGTYDIAIGVYDPLTRERQPLLEREGQQPQDRRLVLDGATVAVKE
ncbi:MAG: hypothetical protein ACWGPS_08470 [Candidatus Promineifilaceae bacterium]